MRPPTGHVIGTDSPPARARGRHLGLRAVPVIVASLLALATAATALYAHVTLVATAPERNATVEEAPSHLRLRFSGTIEQRYTALTLLAPDGREVVLGDVLFEPGSDREFTAAVPRLSAPGTYTVRWRTAGADGHVLQGTWAFTLAPAESDTVSVRVPTADVAAPPADVRDVHDHDDVSSGNEPGAVLARWLHFAALLLLAGALAFRLLLLPRLAADDALRTGLQRRAWRTLAVAALLLVVAAMLRLWMQSAALHGADRAWAAPLLSMMLTTTSWGSAWLVQVALLAVLGAGIALARPPRDRAGLFAVVPATVGLAAIPALTGHAAGADASALIVVNDALHVLAAGAWLGTLAVLLLVAVPLITRRSPAPGTATAMAVERFSPLALGAAALVMVTGAINALLHFDSLADVTGTPYGRTLLVKLGVVGLVGLAGFINWRIVRPALSRGADPRRLRMSAGVELALALLVLLATAVLTGTPRP